MVAMTEMSEGRSETPASSPKPQRAASGAARRALSWWRIVVAWLLAVAFALPVALWEAGVLAQPEVPYVVALPACAFACAALATAALPVGVALYAAIQLIANRARAYLSSEPARRGAHLIYVVVVAVAVAAWAYASALLVSAAFGSLTVQRVALALLQLLAVVLAFACQGSAERTIAKAVDWLADRIGTSLAIALPVGALLAGFATGLLLVAAPILEQLELEPLLAAAALVLAALAAVALAARAPFRSSWGRWSRRAALGLAAASLGLSAWSRLAPESMPLRLALARRATATSWVFNAWHATHLGRGLAPAAGSGPVACGSDEQPPSLDEVGHAPENAPDIILVTVDAARYDHTSLAGYRRDTTPELARHAGRAVVFERAYTPASSTRQTFQAVFAGLYPSQVFETPSTKWGFGFDDAQVTLAEVLRQGGYSTIAVRSEEKVFSKELGSLDGFSRLDDSAVEVRRAHVYSAAHNVDRIIANLSDPAISAPRFIWTHLHEPHQPYPAGPTPVSYGDDEVARYDAALHFVDGEIGRLLAFALSPERRERTWVIVSADHGQAFGEHGSRYHGITVYDEEIHVPLIVWGPGAIPRRYAEAVSLVDLYPTLTELAGLEVPSGLCGRSLVGVLMGRSVASSPIYVEQVPDATRTSFGVAFIRGHDKLVLRPAHGLRELYDLKADPGESKNLGVEEPERLASEVRALRRFLEMHGMRPAPYGL